MTAAIMAAGLGASVAQTVYSVNSVGYVNVTLLNGYNLISNPLNGTNNAINTVIPVAPDQSIIARWDNANQTFFPADTYYVFGVNDPANGWYDGGFNPSTTVINPGVGFFLQNPGGTATITFVGEVSQGSLSNQIGNNFAFSASQVPQSANLLSIGFPAVDQLTYSTFSPVTGYSSALTYFVFGLNDPANGFYDGGFNPAIAMPGVAQGFLISNPGPAVNWTRTFSVN